MTRLPLRRLTLYKHGLGSYERAGEFDGETLLLGFPRRAMDDVLKSLVVLDGSGGQVLGLSFETPPDRNPAMHEQRLQVDPRHALVELLAALRGRQLRVRLDDGSSAEGSVLGVELEPEQVLERARLLLAGGSGASLQVLWLKQVQGIELLDELARADLGQLLRVARSDQEREQTVLKLSPGRHQLRLAYIAPAPAWRVSYRLLLEPPAALPDGAAAAVADCSVLLQGWGLFDNTLDEDLDAVELQLVAGMPVSFRYALHAPQTPERRLVEDEQRSMPAPPQFEAAMAGSAMPPGGRMAKRAGRPQVAMAMVEERFASDALQSSMAPVASGEERGALFAYRVATPVSVGRGQSAMVPLLSQVARGSRELLYNRAKLAAHPVASVRCANAGGLTLERGPVTLFDDGAYGGEAVLEFTPAGAELLLAYAVELGIKVVEQSRYETRVHGLKVADGGLFVQEWQYRITRYEARSSLARDSLLTIEHDRLAGWQVLAEGEPEARPAQLEQPGWARWQLALPAHGSASLLVYERQSQQRREEITSYTDARLAAHLAAHHLDAGTHQRLAAALALAQRIAALKQQLDAQEEQRKRLHERQEQLRQNLAALKDSGPEARLRARLVGELEQLEDQLAALAQAEAALQQQAEAAMEQLAAALEAAAG